MIEPRENKRWLRSEPTKNLVKDFKEEPHHDVNRELSRRARKRKRREKRTGVVAGRK